jgi:hypothetical protein
MFKPKTVATVFSKFTKGLSEVIATQNLMAAEAVSKQEVLQVVLADQRAVEHLANSEVTQAENAIKNIGELLGISTETS